MVEVEYHSTPVRGQDDERRLAQLRGKKPVSLLCLLYSVSFRVETQMYRSMLEVLPEEVGVAATAAVAQVDSVESYLVLFVLMHVLGYASIRHLVFSIQNVSHKHSTIELLLRQASHCRVHVVGPTVCFDR